MDTCPRSVCVSIVQRVFPGASQRCWVSKFLQWKNLTSELQRKERFIYQWERGFTFTTHTVPKKHTNKHLWEYNRDIHLVLSCYNDSWGHGLHHYPKGLIFDTCNCKTQPSPPSERSHLYRCVSTRFFLHLTVLHPLNLPSYSPLLFAFSTFIHDIFFQPLPRCRENEHTAKVWKKNNELFECFSFCCWELHT